MKKKCLISLFFFFLFLTTFSVSLIAQEKITLSISQMIGLAITNNLHFKKVNYQLANLELETQKIEAENLLEQSKILNLQKEINILQQRNTFQDEKNELIIQLVDNYFQLVLAEKDIIRKKKNVELEKEILKEVEAQVARGYSIDLDLLQQGNNYYDALFSYEKAKLNYQQLLRKIKNNLGLSPQTEILPGVVTTPSFPEIDFATTLSQARENNLNIKIKSIEVDQAYIRLEKAKISQEPNLELKILENNLKITELEKAILEEELDYQILTQWQNYRQSQNDILLSEQSLKQMKENELIIRRQVEAGLRTKDDLLSATIGVLDAEYRYISSIGQCYQYYLELKKMMGILDEGEVR